MRTPLILPRKAQVGATLTWIVALIIVIFIMVLYILGTMVIAAIKGPSKDAVQKSVAVDLAGREELISIVYSPVSAGRILMDDITDLIESQESAEIEKSSARLRADAVGILDRICPAYTFQLNDFEIDKSDIDSDIILTAGFSEEISLKIPHGATVTEIKYKKLKEC